MITSKTLKRKMANMLNNGYLKDINLDNLDRRSIISLYNWLSILERNNTVLLSKNKFNKI